MTKVLKILRLMATAAAILCCAVCTEAKKPIKTLIVTGQHNHNWQVSHVAIKQTLENSGLFAVDVAISPEHGGDMSSFKPDFAAYKLVILDYRGERWSEATDRAFLDYINAGGGLVVYHGANNLFREWKEFNRITGFGGWNGRNEEDGPYIYYKDGKVVYDPSPGPGGAHVSPYEFVLNNASPKHPIAKGLPAKWRHLTDELFESMRGPGKVATPLFWSHASTESGGAGRNEINICTIEYGKARIFHTTLGHAGATLEDNPAMQCTGFQVTLLRGAEWAATGKVTQKVPADFPTETQTSIRRDYKPNDAVPGILKNHKDKALFTKLKDKAEITPLFNGKNLDGWYSYSQQHGINNDVEKAINIENGIIHLNGETIGYICTEKPYKNYYLRVVFRWGEKKYPTLQGEKRNSGIHYHFPMDAKDEIWPKSLECQIQEHDCGDYWCDGGTTADSPNRKEENRIIRTADFENPGQEWNTIEMICIDDKSEHYVNGHLVNNAGNLSVSEGKILLQLEGAEIFYKTVELLQLK
jgi:type 1 glutamine amidotransferase